MADGAPVTVVAAHFQSDGRLAGFGLEVFQPVNGITDSLLDRVVDAVKVRMGLKDGVNEPVAPCPRVA